MQSVFATKKNEMKKLIYLPIIALILLTGCKGNSFLTQRYTKLGHSTQQKSKTEKMFIKELEKTPLVLTEITKSKENGDIFVSSVFLKGNIAVPRSGFSALKSKTAIESVFNKSYSKNTSQIKSEAKQFKTKKTFSERSASASGIVWDAFNILISIIVLVVVIVLVVFLVTVLL